MARTTVKQTWGYDLFKGIVTVLLVILALILLVRCSGTTRTPAPTPVAQATATRMPTATPEPTSTTAPTATPAPTATTTPTTAPTATPAPTPPATPPPEPTAAPPALSLPDAEVRAGEWTLEGTGAPGSTVRVTLDGQAVGEVKVGPDGTWSFPITIDEPGKHEIGLETVAEGSVVATADPVAIEVAASEGNEEVDSSTAHPPTLNDPLPSALGPLTGGALRAGPTALQGTGEPGDEIDILDNGVVVGRATVGADGAWQLVIELGPGSHTLAVRSTGQEGVKSPEQSIQVVPAEEMCPFVSVPAGESRCTTVPPHGEDRGVTYVVARCETIRWVAERAGVSVRDLLAANPQVCNPNLIYEGQVLNLPARP